ncbi:MAG TPA: choice-of-anchor B family protein [Gemmatimonadales bacterium]|nr:choice-of-anchor B family protein [Gemmatimonadales bacterium]
MLRTSLFILAASGAAPLHAQTWYRETPVSPIGFGAAVTFAGDELLVARTGMVAGFPMPPSSPGAIHIFHQSGGSWTESGSFAPADTRIGDGFGTALSAAGTWLAIGAPTHEGKGAVYLYERRNGTWTQVSKLVLPDGASGDEFGQAVVLSPEHLVVGAPGRDSARGAAYAWRRGRSGAWELVGELGRGTAAGDRMGAAVAQQQDFALVGAPGSPRPGTNEPTQPGTAVVYRAEGGRWKEETRLPPGDSAAAFGGALAIIGSDVYVGAPATRRRTGAVFGYRREGTQWVAAGTIAPATLASPAGFGSEIGGDAGNLFVAAPMAGGMAGQVYVFGKSGSGWTEKQVLSQRGMGLGTLFGAAMAVAGDQAVIAGPMADFFEGAGYAYARDAASGEWKPSGAVVDRPSGMPAITGREVRCEQGKAAVFACEQMDLLGFLPVSALGGKRGIMLNDIWGWTDSASGREFALVGRMDGTAFVEITHPSNPRYLGELPLHQGANPNLWRDIKVYRNHAFIVSDGAGPHGVQVFDLTQLLSVEGAPRAFSETAHYDRIASAHNIAINESTGFAYTIGNSGGGETCGGALHMIDIRDPKNPKFAGCYADPATGNARTGYTHDNQCVTYQGPDTRYQGREICFNASETAVGIADVTDKANPKPIAVASYPNTAYAHQGWLTEDQKYFYLDDEGDELSGTVPKTRTLVWDVSKLDEPVLVKEFLGTTAATDHNLYVRGNYMFQSNYVSGVRVIDISDPANPKETGFFDTVPFGENVPGFAGSWSNFPFFKSGTIIATSMREGLFIMRHRPTQLVP